LVSDGRVEFVQTSNNGDLVVSGHRFGWLGCTLAATADSGLPDAAKAGFADKLYRLDCGHSLANDESVWTPGENVGRSIEFLSTCWLIERGNEWLLWDTGVPEATLNDPKGWSTLPKLIVYHLDKSNRSTRNDRT
jgi:N-acyl homoserine lactone hydrolase